jgi:lysophospholipase L1-like esterase
MKLHAGVLMIVAVMGKTSASAVAQDKPSAPLGRTFAAVNGTTIQCPLPQARSAEQMAAQFDTRPRDLDEMSRQAQAFFNGDNEVAKQFKAQQAKRFAEDWPFLCRYRDANAHLETNGRRPVAVFMGDSITEGWIEADPEFFANYDYVDRGISGQSSAQMVARFEQDVVALRPSVVHIMAGTNDIGGATGPVTEEEFVDNIRAMLDMAKAHGIAVVLAGMPPMSRLLPRPDFDTRPVVPRLNSRLEELANQYGATWVDYYPPLAASDGSFDPRYANDGVHPTRVGYAIMEPLAKAAIQRALSRSRK